MGRCAIVWVRIVFTPGSDELGATNGRRVSRRPFSNTGRCHVSWRQYQVVVFEMAVGRQGAGAVAGGTLGNETGEGNGVVRARAAGSRGAFGATLRRSHRRYCGVKNVISLLATQTHTVFLVQ